MEVQNFGQIASKPSAIAVAYSKDDRLVRVAAGTVPPLQPFEKTKVHLPCGNLFEAGVEYALRVTVNPDAQYPAILERRMTPLPD